jgi:hypothetical protein
MFLLFGSLPDYFRGSGDEKGFAMDAVGSIYAGEDTSPSSVRM